MRAFVVVIGAILVIQTIGFGLYTWVWPQNRRQRLVRDFAAKRGLTLDAQAAGLAERLLVATRRGRFLGADLGLAAVLGAWWASHNFTWGVSWGFAFTGSIALCIVIPQVTGALGAVLAARRAAPHAGDRRVAHLPVPSLGDYLPPLMRWHAAALLAASGVAAGAAILTWPALAPETLPIGRRGLASSWVACLVAVAVTELAARVVLSVPRKATSPAALAVLDEITGDLVGVVTAGALGPALVLGQVLAGIVPAAGVLAAWLAVLPVVAEGRRRRRVGERLWRPPAVAGPGPSPVGGPGPVP